MIIHKARVFLSRYNQNVNTIITLDTTIYELLKQYPHVASLFVQKHMVCVGCPMGIFDTIREAALYHHVDPQKFFDQVMLLIQSSGNISE